MIKAIQLYTKAIVSDHALKPAGQYSSMLAALTGSTSLRDLIWATELTISRISFSMA